MGAAPRDAADPAEGVVLVVDDDPDIARYVELNLSLDGLTVHIANDGGEAIETAMALQPDLVLLDVMMPGLDGYEVCRRLRASGRTSHCAIIMLTARSLSADTVLGLTAGADDYISKPFDPPELIARVRATLRRAKQLRDVSPLTGLPGNSEITRQVAQRVGAAEPFALIHADLDHFKAFNDRYGFVRGDEAIRATAEVLARVATCGDGSGVFLGHVGGDDFVLITDPVDAEARSRAVVAGFDEMAPSLYDAADAARGWIEVEDRRNTGTRVEIMTISLGVATTDLRAFATAAEASSVASEMKRAAKNVGGSAFRIDRRRV